MQYAKELQETSILINAGCPGFVATDLKGQPFQLTRTAAQGAAIVVRLATLGRRLPDRRILRGRRQGALVTQATPPLGRLW